jgi:cation transport ATPase
MQKILHFLGLKTVIEQAIGEKPNLERITDRIATYFISVVFLLASGTFLILVLFFPSYGNCID